MAGVNTAAGARRAEAEIAGPAARPERRAVAKLNGQFSPWLFLAPALIITLAFVVYPFLRTITTSFTSATPFDAGEFVGIDNYRQLFADPLFWVALRNSVLYLAVVPVMVVLPLLLALLVQKTVPGIGLFRTAIYTPVVASMVVVVVIWQWMFDDRGLINSLLQTLHVISSPIPFLSNAWLILVCAMIVTIWKGLGYYMIVYLAVLANVPRELNEAAEIDGAGPIRRFMTVTVPAMRSTMVLIGVISSVAAFRVFTEVYLLAGPTAGPGGQDSTLVTLIESSGTGLTARLGYSSAVSVVLFVLTIGLLLINLRVTRSKDKS
ncbi:carbohydrate ABC transporter permease [Spelaeicoccus albus]|uniref:Multiple sugar transport system permease protein n=1 Tax=Spelaeicoccus albus TaxID=1280376 RepID=A0A7Z0D1B2_9MICO|nr:sugar ABC transporter permease [Spelaeicoccus albus]NYI66728.1 multiple sugar transport system permease protein [Spelaeicoccus albus]